MISSDSKMPMPSTLIKPTGAKPIGVKSTVLAAELRAQIVKGVLRPGDRLPTFVEMRSRHGSLPATTERVYNLLQQDGLIERVKGSGVYVADAPRRKLCGAIGWSSNPEKVGDPYWRELFAGIQKAAQSVGVHVILTNGDLAGSADIMDGLLIHSANPESILSTLPLHLPMVSVMVPASEIPSVIADDFGGGLAATQMLLQLGHRRIGVLGFMQVRVLRQRLLGWSEALHAAGISPPDSWQWRVEFIGSSSDHEVIAERNMKRWLEHGFRETGCTAILAENDHMALGCIRALQEAGVRVPEDISVVGFDGTETAVRGGLTTVEVPLATIGERGAELLLKCINEPQARSASAERVVLPVKVTTRGSTAPPPEMGLQ